MDKFDEWAFEQCVTNGYRIDSVKNDEGVNIKWVNTTTGETFILDKPQKDKPEG